MCVSICGTLEGAESCVIGFRLNRRMRGDSLVNGFLLQLCQSFCKTNWIFLCSRNFDEVVLFSWQSKFCLKLSCYHLKITHGTSFDGLRSLSDRNSRMPFSWMETGPVALPQKAQVHRSFLVIWRGSRLSLHPLLVRQALCVKDSEKEIIRQDSLLLWMPQVGVGWGNEEAFWVWKENGQRKGEEGLS